MLRLIITQTENGYVIQREERKISFDINPGVTCVADDEDILEVIQSLLEEHG